MRIVLSWQGPLGPGLFPTEADDVEALLQPGVYLRVKRYGPARLVAYVGQSVQVLARIDQHLTNTLGLAYALRDGTGRPCFEPAFLSRLAAFNDIETVAARAVAEAARTQFYFAMCDEEFAPEHLNMVEHLLMRRIEARMGTENRVSPPKGLIEEVIAIESDVSALGEDDRRLLVDLIGAEPLVLEEPALEAEFGA